MKVLMFSTDQNVFEESSSARKRILEYGKLFDKLCVVVYTRLGYKKESIGNIVLTPTNNRFRIGYFIRAWRVGKAVLDKDEDWVVTAQDPFETGLIAYLFKIFFHVPLQIQAHTDFLSSYFKSSLKNRLRVVLGSWLVKKADRIRVVSERIKKSLIELDARLESKIVVLPIFVDKLAFESAVSASRNASGVASEDFLILTVARKGPEKNIDLANEIVGELKHRGNKVKWFHIGYNASDMEPGWLANFIENPRLTAPFYKMADLFLLTSNYEGYGMAAVEAAAAGLPVVMTDVGVALGATFPVGDKERAIAIIEELIKDPGKRRQLVAKQEEFFKNWPTREQYLEKYKAGLTF